MTNMTRALAAIALSLLSISAFSKSRTIKLEIVGPGLAQPLEIVDRAILDRFTIWSGPGASTSSPQGNARVAVITKSFIDWSRGPVSQPAGVKLYTVTFHQDGNERMHEWHRRYVITYAYDPKSQQGYVYLPGPKDGDTYRRNVFSIYHGVEGHWFHASAEWQRSVANLI